MSFVVQGDLSTEDPTIKRQPCKGDQIDYIFNGL